MANDDKNEQTQLEKARLRAKSTLRAGMLLDEAQQAHADAGIDAMTDSVRINTLMDEMEGALADLPGAIDELNAALDEEERREALELLILEALGGTDEERAAFKRGLARFGLSHLEQMVANKDIDYSKVADAMLAVDRLLG